MIFDNADEEAAGPELRQTEGQPRQPQYAAKQQQWRGAQDNKPHRLAAEGEMAILLVEQYYDFAKSLADQYLVMERGEIVARGRGADMERDGVRARLSV